MALPRLATAALCGLALLACEPADTPKEPTGSAAAVAPAAQERSLEGRARYALCKSNVGTVTVIPVKRGAGFGVAVQLDKDATRDFADFTKQRIGDELEVVFAGLIFAKAPLGSPIVSGLLIDPGFQSEAQAQAARRDLLSRLTEEPCGAEF